MKSFVIFFLFFFPYVICNAQSDCTNDTTMYLVAYNYIINDSTNQGKSISVSDSIIDLDRFWFSEDLIALPMEKVKLDKYRANKGYVWYPPFYSPCIALLFGNNSQHQNDVLFFSKIEDNMLRADLLSYKRYADKYNYDQMAFQNVGRVYLFVFDINTTFKAVFSHEIIYD